jgi:PAS domain S-box-containing protein
VDVLGLGLVFILVGLFLFLAARLFLRAVPGLRPAENPDVLITHSHVEGAGEAVLVVQAGGKVRSINSRARQAFHLEENELPDLEWMARRARPADAFLNLCAAEGQARFAVDGRFVEGVSYKIASAQDPMVLVSLRFPELAAGLAGSENGTSAQTLQTFTELTQAIAASLELNECLRAVLENVEKLVPADFFEITLWDGESQQLIPYHYSWVSNSQREIEQLSVRYSPAVGYSGYLCREHTTLLIPDVDKRFDLRPVEGRTPGLRAYLGLPLLVGQEFVGTIELGSRTPDAFREEDLALVLLLSGQAAIALHNALVYRQEKKRSAELSSLSQMAQAFSSVRDPKSVYSRLVNLVAPLIHVQIMGFLLYNESQRAIEAQIPFHGLPDQIVELYRAPVPPNSLVEQTLLDQDVLISEDASSDPQWEILGLSFVAQAASLRETVLVPLNSGGRMMGYLQASNREEGGTFTQSELHLLTILANQTASIIENANLVQQSRQRAQRAEALRRIASLASSAANLDEILKFSIQELARLLHADVGAVLLLDQARTILQLHQPSLFGQSLQLDETHRRMLVDDPQFPFTVTDSQRAQQLADTSSSSTLIPFYHSLLEACGGQSAICVPLVVRSEGIGEMWLSSREVDFFGAGDMQLVATAAGQLAGAAEAMFLRSQTDDGLRRRVEQLTAITRASRELSNSLEPAALLKLIYSEAIRLSAAMCGSVLLFDPAGDESAEKIVSLVHGDEHATRLDEHERKVVERKLPFRVDDYSAAGLMPPHEGVVSSLVAPVFHRQRMTGMIILHGQQAGQFDDPTMEAIQTLAVQGGVALGNAAQYQEQNRRSSLLKRELDTLTELLRVSQLLRPSLPLEQSLAAISGAIRQATPFQVNLISVYEPDEQILRRVVAAGLSHEQWSELQAHTLPWSRVTGLLNPEFRTGNVYYLPADKIPAIPPDVHTVDVAQSVEPGAADAWNPDDFLLAPLYDSQNAPLGLISVDAPSDGRRPDRPTFEALELFAVQAGLMIENYRRATALESRVTQLESERAHLQQSTRSAQENLPMMLRKDLEQTVAVQGLNRRVERMRASLEVAAEAVSEGDAASIIRVLCRGLLTRFSLHTALVAESTPGGVHLVEVIGTVPAGANPEALFGQRNPLRSLLQESKKEIDVLLLANTDNHPDWGNNPLIGGLEGHSLIALLLSGGEHRTGVMVVGQRNLGAFSEEDQRIFEQLAYQVSTGLQNLRLLQVTQRRLEEVNLLLEFSLKLGSLEADNILSTLLERVCAVLPGAQAGWVGLVGPQGISISPQVAQGYTDDEAQQKIHYELGEAGEDQAGEGSLLRRMFLTGVPQRAGEVDFAAQYRLSADDLLNYRQATRGRLPIACMMLPLRLGERVSGALVLENFDMQAAFTDEDEALAYSFSQQAALAVDNARLYQAAETRAVQLQNLTLASGKLTSSLNQDDLIGSLLDLLRGVVPYETATLWMKRGNALSVQAARGFEDDASRIGLTAAVEDSALFLEMIRTGERIVVDDVRADRRFLALAAPENISWLGLPLIVKGEVVGLLAMEKREAGFYTAEHIQAASTFAGQAAAALENSRLFEESVRRAGELDQRSQRLGLLNRLSEELGSSLDINFILKLTAQQLLSAMGASSVACVMLGPGDKFILEIEVPLLAARLPVALLDVPLFDRLKDSRGIFITTDVLQEAELAEMRENYFAPRGTSSLLVVPLMTGSALHGWMLVQKVTSHRFSVAEIELARTVCNQAAIAIQNARQFDETRSLTEFLERRVEERTGELKREHQNSQTLLKVIGELSTSLDMGLVLNRALAVINESLGSQESMTLLLQGSQKPFRAGESLVGLVENPQKSLAFEQEIMRGVARQRQPAFVDDVLLDERWKALGEPAPGYRSLLAAPLVMGEDDLGALLLFHRSPSHFRQGQLDLAEATARQIAISINNAELFNLIRDQSEHLGSLLREQQIEASRSRAILEAVADGVVVTDNTGKVTLFNTSAERILSLKSSQIIGKSLDMFSGLFGRSGAAWLRTIHSWSSEPASYQGESFSDEFDLDNGSIIDVHLAPAFWRSQFLGTVSIFRDITHEVQVDRMKSEFVANVSHELRTPMTSIKGYVEIILMGATGEISGQQRHFLEIVQNNTQRLSELVNDLLDISRIESGRVTLRLQELELPEIAREVILDLQRRSAEENKPMEFRLEVSPDLPSVTGDLERIRQVIANLASNGYNYTPANGIVIVRMSKLDAEVQVDVEDNGIGIGLEEQQRVFDRFYRGEDSLVLATAGTGLGLSVARTLVNMHHGRIWFKSSGVRGEGSIFSFALPILQDGFEE